VHGLRRTDVAFSLVFGSNARGDTHCASDLDLIHVVRASLAEDRAHEYRKVSYREMLIDSNVISWSQLEVLFQDPGWDYRFYRARPIPDYCQERIENVVEWLGNLNTLIRSEPARLRRMRGHLHDAEGLAGILEEIRSEAHGLPQLQCYVVAEIAQLIPMLVLNYYGLIPFQAGLPFSDCTDAVARRSDRAAAYSKAWLSCLARLKTTDSDGAGFHDEQGCQALKRLGRQAIAKPWPESFGTDHHFLLSRRWESLGNLESALRVDGTPALSHLGDFSHLTRTLLGQIKEACLPDTSFLNGTRTSVLSKDPEDKCEEPRLVEFDEQRRRLKVIVPTGGCQFTSCNYCMLPHLARRKVPVAQVLRQVRQAPTSMPLEQVAVYTDGSFFDDRELSENERLLVCDQAIRWGANELLVESLPRFITKARVAQVVSALSPLCALRIGIGLTSTDPCIRSVVTGTPITDSEWTELLDLKHSVNFSLRVFLICGKHMLSCYEDYTDVARSVGELERVLQPSDTVTLNPLLPTEYTLVGGLFREGMFRPMEPWMGKALLNELRVRHPRMQLELGPTGVSSCTNVRPTAPTSRRPNKDSLASEGRTPVGHQAPLKPFSLPWLILGPFEARLVWCESVSFGKQAS